MPQNQTALKADRLRQLREQRGWSRRELAMMCGIGENQVLKYERGENDPSSLSLKLLAARLAVSTDYLLGVTDEPRGHMGDGVITDEESAILDTFRREGWPGVIRLGGERLSNK